MANRDVRAELERWIANVSDEELAAELAEMKRRSMRATILRRWTHSSRFGLRHGGSARHAGAGTTHEHLYSRPRRKGFADYLNAISRNQAFAIARDSRNKGNCSYR